MTAAKSRTAHITARALFWAFFANWVWLGAGVNRCNYAPKPNRTATIWKYPGEDVVLHCPGHGINNRATTSFEYRWYKEDYNCNGMDYDNNVASVTDNVHKDNPRIRVKDPQKMEIEQISGNITIRNLTREDENVFTCIFSRKEEYISTVHLNIKDFEKPVITGLPTVLMENQQENVECKVPTMRPTQGSLRLLYNEKEVRSVALVDGQSVQPLTHSYTGKATPVVNNVTCEVVQNVSGQVKQLSTTAQVTVHYSYNTKAALYLPAPPIENTDVILTCDVTREGNPKGIQWYRWTKDGTEIESSQNFTLSNVTGGDSGSYKCFIQNDADIMTPDSAALNLKLDVVPQKCLPKLDFGIKDIEVRHQSLLVTWRLFYDCSDNPDTEVTIDIHSENDTKSREYVHSTTMASQKSLVVPGNWGSNKNHMVCLILKRFPSKRFCQLMKGVTTAALSSMDRMRKVATVAGYILLGCSVIVVVGCIISAMLSESKRRAAHKRQYRRETIPEDHYEDLDNLQPLATTKDRKDSFSTQSFRNRLASFTGSVRYCPEGTGLPGMLMDNNSAVTWSRSSSSSETPPPLPDFGELIGSRPMEPSPLADSHYNNRMSIVANSPRKNSISFVKTEAPLESLIKSCQDSYGVCLDTVHEQPNRVSDAYMDMSAFQIRK